MDIAELAGKKWKREESLIKGEVDVMLYGGHRVVLWDHNVAKHFRSPVFEFVGASAGWRLELTIWFAEPDKKEKVRHDLEAIARNRIARSTDPGIGTLLSPLLGAIRPVEQKPQELGVPSGVVTSLFGDKPKTWY